MTATSYDRPFGLMFHHFHGAGHPPTQGSMGADDLHGLLHYAKRRWNLLSAAEWYERAVARQLASKDVCLTLDDNLRCQLDVALPVLEDFGLTAFWFVYTSPLEGKLEALEVYRHFRHVAFPDVDAFYEAFFSVALRSTEARTVRTALASPEASRYLSEYTFYTANDRRYRYLRDEALSKSAFDEVMTVLMLQRDFQPENVRAMLWMDAASLRHLSAAGHVVGLHSHTHPTRLDLLPSTHQRAEYEQNKRALGRYVSVDATTMSHPCNAFTGETVAILRHPGVKVGFRADMDPPTTPDLDYSRLEHVYALKAARS